MRRALLFLSTLYITLIISCEENNNPIPEITFNGITKTNGVGQVLTQDASDWQFSDDWDDKEISLFAEHNNHLCNTHNYSITAFPNPCIHRFQVYLSKQANQRFAYCLVDRYYNVLLYSDSTYSSSFYINVDEFNILNDTIRLYYKLIESDCELRGHGDILLE